jgi:hypothetical protein
MACGRPAVASACAATGAGSTASSPNKHFHDGDFGGFHQKKNNEMLMLFQANGGKS